VYGIADFMIGCVVFGVGQGLEAYPNTVRQRVNYPSSKNADFYYEAGKWTS
jgi:hypothetical protein